MKLGLLQILDLIDVTTDILARNLGVGGVVHYAVLRLPRFVEQVAPLSLLAGGLFAFSQLARENAIVSMRSAGLSVYRIVAMTTPVVLAVMAVHFASSQIIAPRTDPMLESWWTSTTPVADRKAQEVRNFRAGGDLISALSASADGRQLTQVTIYRRDAAGRLVEPLRPNEVMFAACALRIGKGICGRGAGQGTGWGRGGLGRPAEQPADVERHSVPGHPLFELIRCDLSHVVPTGRACRPYGRTCRVRRVAPTGALGERAPAASRILVTSVGGRSRLRS